MHTKHWIAVWLALVLFGCGESSSPEDALPTSGDTAEGPTIPLDSDAVLPIGSDASPTDGQVDSGGDTDALSSDTQEPPASDWTDEPPQDTQDTVPQDTQDTVPQDTQDTVPQDTQDTVPQDTTPIDECNTTAECKAQFGDGATDCVNSRSDNSYCMCGAVRCSEGGQDTTPPDTQDTSPQDTTPQDTGGTGTGAFVESGGLVVMEAESANLVEDWVHRTSNQGDPSMNGWTGSGFIEWTGAQYYGNTITPSQAHGVVSYTFRITTAGVYTLRWRTKQYTNVPSGDAGNDTFVRFASGTAPSGAYDFSDFSKVWVQSKDQWSWQTTGEPVHGDHYANRMQRYFEPGLHTLEIAARSPGHAIDRIVLHHSSVAFDAATFTNAPESSREGGGNPGGDPIVLRAVDDFPQLQISGFAPAYKDTARDALAINAATYKDQFAAAQTVWDGPSGTYDVTITTLTEVDGESTYRLVIDGTTIGSFQNPPTTTDYTLATHTWTGVQVQQGDTVQVEFNSHTNGKIPEGDSTAYSRGRWRSLTFTP